MEINSTTNISIMHGPRHPLPNNKQLHRIFEYNTQGKNVNDKLAIIFEDPQEGKVCRLTYATLESKSNQAARQILQYLRNSNRKQPNEDGDYVVIVRMEPSEQLIITLLAIWKIGASYLPLDVNTGKNRIKYIYNDVKPLLTITDQKSFEIFDESFLIINYENINSESVTLPDTQLADAEILANTNSSSVAIVLYTSGSTGMPKGVRLSHDVIMNRLSWQWRTFPFGNNEFTCVFKTAYTFVDAVSEIWAPLLYSDPRTLLIVPKYVVKNPEHFFNVLNIYKIERLVLVPSLLQSILMYLDMTKNQSSYRNNDFSTSIKLWICSGEPLPVSLVKQFFNYFVTCEYKLCNFYGSTEIMGDVTYYVINSLKQLQFNDKIPIGLPVDNTILHLLENNLQPVKKGEIGELFVSGYNVAAGYVNGKDTEKFINNPFTSEKGFNKLYRTGDYGKIVDGVLLYEGRVDSQIKIRGQRVDLSEVQAALNNLSVVQKSTVLCYKPGDVNQVLLAFVTISCGCAITATEIQFKLKEFLAAYAIPRVFIIDNLPLLNNGKVDRQKLLQMYSNNAENENKILNVEIDYKGIDGSKLKAAKCLFETLCSVLGGAMKQLLTVTDNFYEIGGNSLNCIHTITKIRERGYFIGIADFITASNLDAIISRMQLEKQIKENIPNTIDLNEKDFTKTNYKCEMLGETHKESVFKIIGESFYEKADLEQWLVPKPKRECYTELLEAMWKPLVNKNLSFAVYSKSDKKYVGACLNFDAHDEPEINIQSNLTIVFDFLEYLEGPFRDKKLPTGKRQIWHSFMMGTDQTLTAAQNIQVVTYMESEILNLAKRKGFAGVFTTNTNALTQQLGQDVFKYNTLLDYQVNQYVTPDGQKPFALAPDEQRCIVCWRPV